MNLLNMIIWMFIGSFIVQYYLMPFIMIDKLSNFTNNVGKAYMSFVMGFFMVFIELLMHDYPYKKIAFSMYGIVFLFIILLSFLYKKQIGIDDKQYLEGMIEHHSMAILTSEEIVKKSNNKEVSELANNIIALQKKEIQQMKNILKKL